MCGIVGSVTRTGFAPENSSSREKALSLISHRGPDAHGECTRGSVWFGHTRLSILDLSESGSQPMLSEDGRFAITYNGEVYNYRDLASSLELTDLHSTCDTEVVLRSFAQIGSSAFRQLNGMFAFALHDQETHAVWLVRDRLGIKPLYYYLDHERLVFASELRALITLLGHTPECNIDGLHEWMFYGNSLGERTLYKNICQLLPGHFLHLDTNTFKSKFLAYWSLKDASALSNQTKDSTKQLIVSTRRLLESAVQRQLISDVPVGVFLSGGIDSSAITAFAARHYKGRLATFAAGFDDPYYKDERPKACRVAKHFGTDHHELFIEGRDIAGVVEALIDHHGMPFFDAANIPLYLMAKKVSGEIKVVLQGDGGDEVFGGYRRYASLRMHPLLHALAGPGKISSRALPASRLRQRIIRYCDIYGQEDLGTTIGLLLTSESLGGEALSIFTNPLRDRIAASDPMSHYREVRAPFSDLDIGQQMSMVDLSIELPYIYLEKVDRSTMAHGLEVRVPFLDHDLIDFAVRIPGYRKMPYGQKKWLLKKSLRGIVPDFVLDGPKTGFSVPFRHWLLGPLKQHFFDHLSEFQHLNPGVICHKTLNEWFAITEHGKADFSPRLWKLYNFMIWANRFDIQLHL